MAYFEAKIDYIKNYIDYLSDSIKTVDHVIYSMKNNTKLYIVPGFGESVSDSGYMKITKIAEDYGYHVIPVSIQWSKRTATHWVKDFLDVVEKNGSEN